MMGMVPQPAYVLDELAAVVDQSIVDGNDTTGAVAGLRVVLQPGQTAVIERRLVPGCLDQPAVEARLIRGDGELSIDGAYVFAFCHHQPGEVFGKMAAGGFVVEDIAGKVQCLFHKGWEVHSPEPVSKGEGRRAAWESLLQKALEG